MKTDHLWHWSNHAVSKVAVDGVSHHGTQLIQSVTLSYNGVPKGCGHVTSIGGVFLDFENDLAHRGLITPPIRPVNAGPASCEL